MFFLFFCKWDFFSHNSFKMQHSLLASEHLLSAGAEGHQTATTGHLIEVYNSLLEKVCWQLLFGSLLTCVFTCIIFTDFFILQYLSRIQNMTWTCPGPSVIRLSSALPLTSCPDFIFSWLNPTECHIFSSCYVNSRCFNEEENLVWQPVATVTCLTGCFFDVIYSLNQWWRDVT